MDIDLRLHLDDPGGDLHQAQPQRSVSNWASRQEERRGIRARRLHSNQYAPAAKTRRNWLAVALVQGVRSAARCVFQAFT
jgi:hypothetical protein